MTKIFPSLIPDSDGGFIDNTYNADELQKKEYDELRAIAATHPSDDVNGRMSKSDLREALEGKQRV